jgi:hypothetical protein
MKNTIQLWKKIMEEAIIKPIGSQHILFSVQSFAIILCEGFVLILKFVMRIYWGARGDSFLLDTTIFSLVVFALSRGVYWELLRCILRSSFIRQLSYMDIFWPCHEFFINHYKMTVFGVRDGLRTRCSCMSIVCQGLCLLVCSTFRFHEMSFSQCYVHQDVALWAMRSLRHYRRYDDLCHLLIELFQFWGQWHRLRLLLGDQSLFVCFVNSYVVFGQPAIDLLNVTSWEVY